VENYDPTIEGQWLNVLRVLYFDHIVEQYRRTITVDGQLDMVCTYLLGTPNESWEIIYILPIIFPDSKQPIRVQLEVLDTAGAEQFTSLNEVYIKVATSFNTIRRSSDNSRQSGRGFVLVFRSKFLPT
jgi:hypothetical protein